MWKLCIKLYFCVKLAKSAVLLKKSYFFWNCLIFCYFLLTLNKNLILFKKSYFFWTNKKHHLKYLRECFLYNQSSSNLFVVVPIRRWSYGWLAIRSLGEGWWTVRESNPWPLPCHGSALPTTPTAPGYKYYTLLICLF